MKAIIIILLAFTAGAYGQIVDDCTAYWAFEEGTSPATDAVGSNDATATSMGMGVTGKHNYAFSWNGSTSVCKYTTSISAGATVVSVSLWVYQTSSDADALLIEETASGYWQYAISASTWYTRDGSTGTTGSRNNDLTFTQPTLNTWTHYVFVYSSTGGYKRVYRNGSLDASTTTSVDQLTSIRDDNNLMLGCSITDPTLTGRLDEIAIFDVDMSTYADEMYNGGTGWFYPFSGGTSYNPVSGRDVRILSPYPPFEELIPLDHVTGSAMYLHNPYASGGGTEPPAEFDGTIYNSWDFENEQIGTYTDEEIQADFVTAFLWSHNSAEIATDEINGASTKVLKVTHVANDACQGFEMGIDFQHDYDEIWMTYDMKFSNEYVSNHGAKIPGPMGLPRGWTCDGGGELCNPPSGYGFVAMNMVEWGGGVISYHYDRTLSFSPWAYPEYGDYQWDPFYFSNGTWYEVTQYIKMNTFTGSTPNADGIKEIYINGKMIVQETGLRLMENNTSSMKIDGLRFATFYGGCGNESYESPREVYTYFDNIKIYMPNGVSSGAHNHAVTQATPSEITDRTVYHDYTRNTAGTFHNAEYGSNYSDALDETYLVDAGAGHTITYSYAYGISSSDYLFFYDGNTTDANLLHMHKDASGSTTITTSGRYLFVRLSTDVDGYGSTGFTGTLTFN
jgi:hypothetical protein